MGSREYNPWKAHVDNKLNTTNGKWDAWGNLVGRASDYRYETHPRASREEKSSPPIVTHPRVTKEETPSLLIVPHPRAVNEEKPMSSFFKPFEKVICFSNSGDCEKINGPFD